MALTGCASDDDSRTVLRLAHGLDTSHPVHGGMEVFAQEVESRTNGEVRIIIYPNEQLGSERECLELLQLGALDITKSSTAILDAFIEEYAVFGLPYVFRGDEHMWAVLEGEVGQEILESGRDVNLLGLCYYDAGARSFYTTRHPIHQPSDLQGLSIRVQQSDMAIRMVRAMGGSPTPVSWGELYSALQQGVVDGAENNPPSFYTSNHYEVCRYYTLDEHQRVPDVLLIRPAVFDGLSDEHQQAFREAAEVSVAYQRELWREDQDKALAAVEEAGVTIIEPDISEFQEAVQPLWAMFEGTVIGDLAERVEAVPGD